MKDKDPTVLIKDDEEENAHALHASPVEEPVDRSSEEPETQVWEESMCTDPEEPDEAAALHISPSLSMIVQPAHSLPVIKMLNVVCKTHGYSLLL
eukprot:6490952-Amphidinium_carterae.1